MTTTITRLASEKQLEFITRLLGERDTCGTPYAMHATAPAHLTSRQASDAITVLLTLPKAGNGTPADEIAAGVYSNADSVGAADATFFRVYLGQNSGTMLAKEIMHHSDGPLAEDQYLVMEYRGAATRFVTEGFRRLSLEEVGRWGVTTNHCLCCGRRLDDPESVDRGIGPVCAKNY
jgi:hypothetical protein